MRAVALRCPYCRASLNPTDAIIRCSRCFAGHHTACWEEIHHCSVFACNGSAYYARTVRRDWTEIGPAIILLLMYFFPREMSLFMFLLVPAHFISLFTVIHITAEISCRKSNHFNLLFQCERAALLVLNILAILANSLYIVRFLLPSET